MKIMFISFELLVMRGLLLNDKGGIFVRLFIRAYVSLYLIKQLFARRF